MLDSSLRNGYSDSVESKKLSTNFGQALELRSDIHEVVLPVENLKRTIAHMTGPSGAHLICQNSMRRDRNDTHAPLTEPVR